MKLEPPHTHIIRASEGWIELGNAKEAAAELDLLPLELQQHPDVIELRWSIEAHSGRWETALSHARALVKLAPERASGWLHQAYALRRVTAGGLKKAWEALLPAASKFPKEATIPYNLSCYACQMDQLDAARVWLKRAAAVAGKKQIREMALLDQDLEPLWEEIRQL
jgi:predicted Zn-dependent protease